LKSVRLYRMDDKMECIICQDNTLEPLQDNTYCDCKYKIHASCWIDYVHSKTIITCLICRKERVESKKEIISASSLPTIIEEQEQEQEQEQQQEQEQSHQSYNSVNQIQPQVITTREMNIKIIKIIIFIVILVFIVVLIWS